jgi:ParB family transcriptional regulator, chromosome partitioning protein
VTAIDHATSAAEQAGAEPGSAAAQALVPGWELVHVDPTTLVIGANTRITPEIGKAFLGSVRDRGVREPIIARRGHDGVLLVRKGQRRTLAAVAAGLALVPVIIEPEQRDGETERQVDRIIDQLEENQHRAELPERDEVGAHQQLLDLGLTAGQIARRTHTRLSRVKATTAVAASAIAVEAMGRHELSLEHAAVLAEFDDDPETVAALVAAIRTGQFEHVAQRARDARAEVALRQRLTDELAQSGVQLVEQPPAGRRDAVRALRELRASADSEPGQALTESTHAGCGGHVAWLVPSWRPQERVRIEYGCDDWRAHGHADLYAQEGVVADDPDAGGQRSQWSEEQKAERRVVIANNKAWLSATTVRRRWLRAFLTRKSAPKDAQQWIAATLADGSHPIRRAMEQGHRLAAELLGLPVDATTLQRISPIAAAAESASPGRATVLTLAILLAAQESALDRNAWRAPTRDASAYLLTLAGWGYSLSEVEQLAVPGLDAEQPTPDRDAIDAAAGEDSVG